MCGCRKTLRYWISRLTRAFMSGVVILLRLMSLRATWWPVIAWVATGACEYMLPRCSPPSHLAARPPSSVPSKQGHPPLAVEEGHRPPTSEEGRPTAHPQASSGGGWLTHPPYSASKMSPAHHPYALRARVYATTYPSSPPPGPPLHRLLLSHHAPSSASRHLRFTLPKLPVPSVLSIMY